jgi:hypothetical protein
VITGQQYANNDSAMKFFDYLSFPELFARWITSIGIPKAVHFTGDFFLCSGFLYFHLYLSIFVRERWFTAFLCLLIVC